MRKYQAGSQETEEKVMFTNSILMILIIIVLCGVINKLVDKCCNENY